MIERRGQIRRRTLLNGRIEISNLNGWALDCTVRNLSESGARLAIPGDIVVPQNVGLAVSNGAQRPAKLIWYRAGEAGFALSERRVAPRPTSADDLAVAAKPAGLSRLQTRIAAIAG